MIGVAAVALLAGGAFLYSASGDPSGPSYTMNGQRITGLSAARAEAEAGLTQLAARGANIESAKCHLKLEPSAYGGEEAESSNDVVPTSILCYPIGFLGAASGMDSVELPLVYDGDPSNSKQVVAHLSGSLFSTVLSTALPPGGRFDPAIKPVDGDVPQGVVPDGMLLLAGEERLYRESDIQQALDSARKIVEADSSHAANEQFTLAEPLECVTTATPLQAMCGPAVSILTPGQVGVVMLDLGYTPVDPSEGVYVGDGVSDTVSWVDEADATTNTISADGKPVRLKPASTLERPKPPVFAADTFVELSGSGCVTGSDELTATSSYGDVCFDYELQPEEIEQGIDGLRWISGSVSIEELNIASGFGDGVLRRDASPGTHLVLARLSLDREDNEVSLDTDEINAQLKLGDRVLIDWNKTPGSKTVFVSVPDDQHLEFILSSNGETQSININASTGKIERVTSRPEIYVDEEATATKFSSDQTIAWSSPPWTLDGSDTISVYDGRPWSSGSPVGRAFVDRTGATQPTPGSLAWELDLGSGTPQEQIVAACSATLAFSDGTVAQPDPAMCALDNPVLVFIAPSAARPTTLTIVAGTLTTTYDTVTWGAASIPAITG